MHCWLVCRVDSNDRRQPYEAVKVEQEDGSKLTFAIGERVRLRSAGLPNNAPFAIVALKEVRGQPVVVVRYREITTYADPFDLRKLSPLEQLAMQVDAPPDNLEV